MLKYFQVATVTIKIVFHRFMFALITQDILVKKLSLFFILNFCKIEIVKISNKAVFKYILF